MPIRLPDIPGVGATPIGAPTASANAIGAPAVALGNVAQAIAGVSSELHDTAVQIQKLENHRRASEFRQETASQLAALNLELQKDPDPASRIARTKDFLDSRSAQIVSGDLPPALQADLSDWFGNFATRSHIAAAEDAARIEARAAKAVPVRFRACRAPRRRKRGNRRGVPRRPRCHGPQRRCLPAARSRGRSRRCWGRRRGS